jgi:hypothetical protein
VYWYGSQAAGEMVCAVEQAAATVGVRGLVAPTACQSPIISALRARASARQGQAVVPDSGVDPIAQQSLRFDDDVVEAPCDPATDGAACLIQPATQLQARQQAVPPPIPPEPEEPVSTVTVTANAGAGGSISPSTQTVPLGATARFTVTPNSGYAIAAVTGCNGSLNGTVYVTGPITTACTVSASFTAAQTYALTLNVAGTGAGAVNGAGRYAAGDTVTLTATPNSGSVFAGWNPAPCAATFTMPAQNLTCIATFTLEEPATFNVTGSWSGSFYFNDFPACTGTLSVRFEQTGTRLTGFAVATINQNTPSYCEPGASESSNLSGTVEGSQILYGVASGLTYTGTIAANGNSISGTAVDPDGYQATWQLTRN